MLEFGVAGPFFLILFPRFVEVLVVLQSRSHLLSNFVDFSFQMGSLFELIFITLGILHEKKRAESETWKMKHFWL